MDQVNFHLHVEGRIKHFEEVPQGDFTAFIAGVRVPVKCLSVDNPPTTRIK